MLVVAGCVYAALRSLALTGAVLAAVPFGMVGGIFALTARGLTLSVSAVLGLAAVASAGFLPMAISNRVGVEVQQPIAWVMVGGLATSTAVTLFVLPLLLLAVEGARRQPGSETIATTPEEATALRVADLSRQGSPDGPGRAASPFAAGVSGWKRSFPASPPEL